MSSSLPFSFPHIVRPVRTSLLRPRRRLPSWSSSVWLLLVVVATALTPGWAAEWSLEGDARWLQNDQVLAIDAGSATLEGEPFVDGEVSLEMQLSGARSFVYVRFRNADGENWEEIYLRGHKSNSPDGLQYTPVLERSSQWQLFHGEGGTAAVEMPTGSWIPLRVQFVDRVLRVFVGAGDEPDLVIPRMTHGPVAGSVSLRSFLPRGTQAPFGVRVRNVEVRPGRPFDPAAYPAPEAASDVVREWRAGAPFAIAKKTITSLDAVPASARSEWREVVTEPDGTALLARLGLPQTSAEARFDAVVARLEVDADEAVVRALELGFSDAVTVFLNGRPLVALDQSYRYDRPRVQGVLGLHQARIFLPLERGSNTLEMVVTDSFGGWALMGRWMEEP